MKKEKTIKLTQGHRATIRDTFSAAVNKRQASRIEGEMTPLIHAAMRKLYTAKQLEAYNAAPVELCSCVSGEGYYGNCISVRNTLPDGQQVWFSTRLTVDDKFRVPLTLTVPAKLYDQLCLAYETLTDEARRAKEACNAVVAACRTVADLKARWPDGRAFWGELVNRLEDESGTSVSCSLIPMSQIKALNDYCVKRLTGAEA